MFFFKYVNNNAIPYQMQEEGTHIKFLKYYRTSKNVSVSQSLVLVYSTFLPSALLNNLEEFYFYD